MIFIEITRHAQARIKERCGLPKKAMKRNASLALSKGISHKEASGKLKKYIDWLFLSHKNGGKIRLYNNHVYIFSISDVLITVLPLPNMYKNAVNKIVKRTGEQFNDE